MAIDDAFDGFDHDSLPSVHLDFSCKSEVQSTTPEVIVDIQHDGQWIRLPITSCETRMNKDGPADLTTTSRVDLPVTWGQDPDGNEKIPIYEYVGDDREDDETGMFNVARVFYWNQYNESFQIEQFGYVATIGPSSNNGEFRFYIYDVADMMSNISVSKTYDEPTAQSVADFVAFDPDYGLEANTPVSVNRVTTTIPADIERADTAGTIESFDAGVRGWVSENTPITWDINQGAEDRLEWLDNALHASGHKHFRRNRHNLVDVMDWLTDEVGGVWYFEPMEDGVALVVNNGTENDFAIARTSYYDGQFNPYTLDYITGSRHSSVDVINNTSLEDLKPINYLELNGESADSFLGINSDRVILGGPLGAPRGHTDKYPHVEVRYPPLLERSGGRELGPRPIDSGKQTLGEAQKEAVKLFKQEHEDSTDGSVEIRALPSIRPYDYIAAVPVCNDTFDADMNPIQYEVNTVVHSVSGGEPYTTELGVSIALDENAIEVEASLEDINPDD